MVGGVEVVWNRFAVVGIEGVLLLEKGDDIEGRGREGMVEIVTSPAMVYMLMVEEKERYVVEQKK
jgi:hypothetical protein